MKRREFIKVVSVASAGLALGPLVTEEVAQAAGNPFVFDAANPTADRFPQSVGSGDPTPGSLILWTRVQPMANDTAPKVVYQVARTPDFGQPLAQGTFTTGSDMDYTVRVKLMGLDPATTYYYRFSYSNTTSKTGRAKTAPTNEATSEVKFGFISCQDYTNGFYPALGILAQEDLDFVVFLGDYVYETTGAGFQGQVRNIPLPDGGDLGQGGKFALTLADYRTLYKTYRSDLQLQAVHEAFAFITIWDDHEFSNDAWGANGTYFNEAKSEYNVTRRKAANRAWYEFTPADIGAYDDSKTYDNSLTIYRTFRFGTLLELIMTDERLYRTDHLIPEGPAIPAINKPANSELGSRYFVPKQYFDAVEAAKPAITMLGATQKDWFKARLSGSAAKWKVWGNEVSLLRMLLNLPPQTKVPPIYLDLDQWDGYNRERSELMKFIKDQGLKNVVAVTGDIHAFIAGKVYENFDDQSQPPAMVDFSCAGVASQPFYYALYGGAAAPGSAFGALEPILRYNPATDTNGVDSILLSGNPHLKHTRTLAYGYATVTVQANRLRVALKEVNGIDSPQRTLKRVFNYLVPLDTPDILPESPEGLPTAGADRWLAITGFEVTNQQGFLDYWRQNGGLKAFGYPISPVLLEEGKQVQYFERQRFEYFPNNQPPYRVQLGLLGYWAASKVNNKEAFAPTNPAGYRYYTQTKHNLSPRFQAFWDSNGGLPIFGFPISEEFEEQLAGQPTRKVQYFERTVLRYFPENSSEFQAQGDLLGVAYYQEAYFR